MKYVPCYVSITVNFGLDKNEKLFNAFRRQFLKYHYKFHPEKLSGPKDQIFGLSIGTPITRASSHFVIGPAKFSIVWRRKNEEC